MIFASLDVRSGSGQRRIPKGEPAGKNPAQFPECTDCRLGTSEDLARQMGDRFEVCAGHNGAPAFVLAMTWLGGVLQEAAVEFNLDEFVMASAACS